MKPLFALLLIFSTTCAQDVQPTTRSVCNVCADTPEGLIRPGEDITKALQWALNRTGRDMSHAPAWIPSGRYYLSETVTTPHSHGIQLHGAGARSTGKINSHETGIGTVLEWRGKAGGTMIVYAGAPGDIGHFSLRGQYHRNSEAPKAEIGLLFTKLKKGISTGNCVIRHMRVAACRYGVQAGRTLTEHNSDNLQFEFLDGEDCQAIYHGVNNQNVDIVIQHLRNGGCDYGVLVDGGGQLWIQSSLSASASKALLKINDTRGRGTGQNNGSFRISHAKYDQRAGDEFCLVDCEESHMVSILVDGGHLGRGGGKAPNVRICGMNHVTMIGGNGSVRVHGTKARDVAPSCDIYSWRLWNDPATLFSGDLDGFAFRCKDARGQRLRTIEYAEVDGEVRW